MPVLIALSNVGARKLGAQPSTATALPMGRLVALPASALAARI